MGLFSQKPSFCTICGVQLKYKHKPKREWGIKGTLCGDCQLDKSQEYHDAKSFQKCIVCDSRQKIMDLWEPRWQWDMDGLLCKDCFDKKEQNHNLNKNFCSICGAKLGFIRYNPKSKWAVKGQICKNCWNEQKTKLG